SRGTLSCSARRARVVTTYLIVFPGSAAGQYWPPLPSPSTMCELNMLLLVIAALQTVLAGTPEINGPAGHQLIRTPVTDAQDSTDVLRLKAERGGDPAAEYKLGLAYDVGVGAPQDLAQAAAWYERAAEQGHAGAQFSLGLMYGNGRGVPQDLVRAHMW